jgi:GlpG protein
MVLLTAATSNSAQYLVSGGGFGGMSGVDYGLFAYIWAKGHFSPEEGMGMPRETAIWLIGWYVLCFTGLVGDIANTAHTLGLITGAGLALVPVAWKNVTR